MVRAGSRSARVALVWLLGPLACASSASDQPSSSPEARSELPERHAEPEPATEPAAEAWLDVAAALASAPGGCPPEDLDGWMDEDGCADLDNDLDGIIDELDACPNTPEDFDGDRDEDGCFDCSLRLPARVAEPLLFAQGSKELGAEAEAELDELAAALVEDPTTSLRISGHTSAKEGSPERAKRLSLARAEVVAAALVERGIDPARLSTHGFGDDVPVDTNRTEEGRIHNRRVEFEALDKNGE